MHFVMGHVVAFGKAWNRRRAPPWPAAIQNYRERRARNRRPPALRPPHFMKKATFWRTARNRLPMQSRRTALSYTGEWGAVLQRYIPALQ